MPRQSADDIKIIVRPRDGLSIRHTCRASLDEAIRQEAGLSNDEIFTICPNPTQNILVIITPDEKTPTKFVEDKDLKINEKKYETDAYVSAPEHMAKGIIHSIPLKYTHDQLMHALVNARNPSLAYAKRLGSTTTVILLYEGNRVPMWAYFNSIITPAGSRLTRPGHLGKQQHTTSPSTHIKVQIQDQAGSLGTTSLGVKVQKQTQDQEWVEIHL
ncbi:hypothetical protein HPB51_013556 [Rhipicephalus microplus]|uniref:Uncharacterized protein n=1 Tax=Rhipicephalus microplus TaxID=6941 RepID=A0A9J6D9R8_RHIMP|nr:hypothetical protein HPB51_013556 [Rhipicephalus microplus]